MSFTPVGAASTHVDTTGLQGGFDFGAGVAWIGIAAGYDYQWLHDAAGGKGRDQVASISLYGAIPLGTASLSGVLSYAHGADTIERATGIGNATANRSFNDFVGAAQLSTQIHTGGATLTPAAGISFARLSSDPFTETFARSAAFALTGTTKDLTSVSPYVTVSLSKTVVTSGGLSITPLALAGYRYDRGADGQDITLTAADGTIFAGNHAGLPKSAAILGAGLAASQGRWTAYVKYRGSLASGWTDNYVTAGLQITF